jgi:hypothetical protein
MGSGTSHQMHAESVIPTHDHRELSAAAFDSVPEELQTLVEVITTLDPTTAIALATYLEEGAFLLQGTRYSYAATVLEGALKKALGIFDKFIVGRAGF